MIRSALLFLLFPGLIITLVMGFLASWVDRKVTARIQYRKGPVLYQPFADIVKLIGKEIIIPDGASYTAFILSPIFAFSSALLVSTMLWIMNANTYTSFIGDLIVLLYLMMIPSIAIIIGASASRNPFAALGASREMKLMLAYELPFIISIISIISHNGTLFIGQIINYQTIHGANIMSISGAIAFIICLLVVQAKLGFVPFDIAEADQEIMGGVFVEYSGIFLATFKLAKTMLLVALPMLLITLFMGGADFYSLNGILWFIFKYVIILTLMILIKNTNPRLRIDQAVRFFWGPVTALAIVGLILSVLGY